MGGGIGRRHPNNSKFREKTTDKNIHGHCDLYTEAA